MTRSAFLCIAAFAAGCQPPPDHEVPIVVVGFGADLAAPRDLAPRSDGGARDAAPADLALPQRDAALDGGGLATLVFTVTDRDTRLPTPSRVIFRAPPGSGFADNVLAGPWTVNSKGSATGATVAPGVVGSPEGVLLQSGQGVVPVPAGDYTLVITRGPEYEIVELPVTLAPGEVRQIAAELDRTVDTRGWLAADLHVHTRSSYDSRLPLERRVISMTTNGIELIVSTEHNNSIDLAPSVAALGYGADTVGTIIGEEFNFGYGHGGAYPVTYDASKPNGGVPTWIDPCVPGQGIQCTLAQQAFDIMHAQIPNTTVLTINHPWWGGADLGWFTNVGWGAGTAHPLPASLPAYNFDALEVLNGYWTRGDAINYLVTDWFYLLSTGHRVTALGNSDTHKINWVRAGWPRTWLRLPTDRPGEVTGAQLGDAIRNQRAIASTGPFITLTVDGAQIGDTVVPRTAGQVTVQITVDAPAWMAVDTVRLYLNGQEKEKLTVAPGHRPVFSATLTETVSGDAFFVAQAGGTAPLPGDVVGEYAKVNGWEMLPWAITNPVFVDANGDGTWQAPPWQSAPPSSYGMMRARSSGDWRDWRRVTAKAVPEECEPALIEPALIDSERSDFSNESAAAREAMQLLYP